LLIGSSQLNDARIDFGSHAEFRQTRGIPDTEPLTAFVESPREPPATGALNETLLVDHALNGRPSCEKCWSNITLN
jgi:hypothetical protein